VKLAIADDHGIFRDSLTRALQDIGAEVMISVASGGELLAQLGRHEVDVAIVDVLSRPRIRMRAWRRPALSASRSRP
jgi:DNA-binding NarL/FixJ family response regulator